MRSHRFIENFPRQLRFWSLHAMINGLPSLGIALGWMGLRKVPAAWAGMFSAIATFALVYAVLTSLEGPFSDPRSTLAKAVKLGARIRIWISGISLVMVAIPPLGIFSPDTWCGIGAIHSLNWLWRMAGQPGVFFEPSWASNYHFMTIYIVALTEGLILSFLLFVICFFAVLRVQAVERRRLFPT